MTTTIKAVLALAGALLLLLLIAAGVQTWRLGDAQASIASQAKDMKKIKGDLADAQEEAARWRVTAQTRAVSADAQADLAAACIKREAQARTDAAELTAILSKAQPQISNPEQTGRGVDDATRQRIAALLNRPL